MTNSVLKKITSDFFIVLRMQFLPTRRLFLTSQHNFLSCPACPEITEVAYAWFKQVCHRENNAAEALQETTCDFWLETPQGKDRRAGKCRHDGQFSTKSNTGHSIILQFRVNLWALQHTTQSVPKIATIIKTSVIYDTVTCLCTSGTANTNNISPGIVPRQNQLSSVV